MRIDSPFTRFVVSELDDQDHKMVAMAIAPHIEPDFDAPLVDFDESYQRNAFRIMSRVIKYDEMISLSAEQNSIGRPRDHHMLSANQFEESPARRQYRRWQEIPGFHATLACDLACDRQAVMVVKGSSSPLPPSFLSRGMYEPSQWFKMKMVRLAIVSRLFSRSSSD